MPSGRIELGAPALLVIFFIIAAITALVCLITKKNVTRGIFTALTAMYLVAAASLTVLPIYIGCGDIAARFAEDGWRLRDCISLVPFKNGFGRDAVLNVLLTVPFGFLLPLVRRRCCLACAAAAGLAFGICVELIQLVTAFLQGFSYRVVDTTDVICNFAGTLLGWLLIFGITGLIKKLGGEKEADGGLLGYVIQTRF